MCVCSLFFIYTNHIVLLFALNDADSPGFLTDRCYRAHSVCVCVLACGSRRQIFVKNLNVILPNCKENVKIKKKIKVQTFSQFLPPIAIRIDRIADIKH